MKDYSNEKKFAESLLNHTTHVKHAQQYIKENFNLESEYDCEDMTLHIKLNNINESLDAALAKQYVTETIDQQFITVVFD